MAWSSCDSGAAPGNRKATFAYDDMDRPLSTTFGDGSPGSPGITRSHWPYGREKTNSSGTFTWAMEYNNRRLLTKETYSFRSFRSYGDYPIQRLYDAYGHQQQINYWGEKKVAYAPNALGQPTWDCIPTYEWTRLLWRVEVMLMEVFFTTVERSHIGIDRDELLILNAALNEVCNGIEVFEFETRIGADRERVAALLKVIGSLLDKMDSPHT